MKNKPKLKKYSAGTQYTSVPHVNSVGQGLMGNLGMVGQGVQIGSQFGPQGALIGGVIGAGVANAKDVIPSGLDVIQGDADKYDFMRLGAGATGLGLILNPIINTAEQKAEANKVKMRNDYLSQVERINAIQRPEQAYMQLYEDGTAEIKTREDAKLVEVEHKELVFKRNADNKLYLYKDFDKAPTHKEGGIIYEAEEGDVIIPKDRRDEVMSLWNRRQLEKLETLISELPKDSMKNEYKKGTSKIKIKKYAQGGVVGRVDFNDLNNAFLSRYPLSSDLSPYDELSPTDTGEYTTYLLDPIQNNISSETPSSMMSSYSIQPLHSARLNLGTGHLAEMYNPNPYSTNRVLPPIPTPDPNIPTRTRLQDMQLEPNPNINVYTPGLMGMPSAVNTISIPITPELTGVTTGLPVVSPGLTPELSGVTTGVNAGVTTAVTNSVAPAINNPANLAVNNSIATAVTNSLNSGVTNPANSEASPLVNKAVQGNPYLMAATQLPNVYNLVRGFMEKPQVQDPILPEFKEAQFIDRYNPQRQEIERNRRASLNQFMGTNAGTAAANQAMVNQGYTNQMNQVNNQVAQEQFQTQELNRNLFNQYEQIKAQELARVQDINDRNKAAQTQFQTAAMSGLASNAGQMVNRNEMRLRDQNMMDVQKQQLAQMAQRDQQAAFIQLMTNPAALQYFQDSEIDFIFGNSPVFANQVKAARASMINTQINTNQPAR